MSVASGPVFLLVGSNSRRRKGTDPKTGSGPKIIFSQARVRQFRWPSKGLATETDSDRARQCEGVGIKEGVPACQSALLHGPKLFLRWVSHSMSSCDGVRPIVVRAGADLPEGVTYTPREGSWQPTLHRANWQSVSMFCCFGPCIRRCESAVMVLVHRVGCFSMLCCRGSRILRPCRCGDFGFVSRHKPAEHRFPEVSANPDVEASCVTSCCGRRVLSLKDVAASQYVCSRGADNLSSYVSSFGSDLSSTCFRWC